MIKLFLEYQDTDMQLFAIEKELKGSQERKDYALLKKAVSDANEQVQRLDRECEELIHSYNKTKGAVDKIIAEVNELTEASQSIGDSVEEYDFYIKNIDKLLAQLESMEQDLSRLVKSMEDKRREFEKLMDYGRKITVKLREAQTKYRELEASKKDEAKPITEKLASMEKELDEALLKTYKQLRSMKPFPIVVPRIGDERRGYSCRGCGMELPETSRHALQSAGDYVECPNCHRIVYVD